MFTTDYQYQVIHKWRDFRGRLQTAKFGPFDTLEEAEDKVYIWSHDLPEDTFAIRRVVAA